MGLCGLNSAAGSEIQRPHFSKLRYFPAKHLRPALSPVSFRQQKLKAPIAQLVEQLTLNQ